MTRRHFYSLCFVDMSLSEPMVASCVMAVSPRVVSQPVIDMAKQRAGLTPQAVMLSVAYLGYMSEEEFTTGEVPAP